MSKTVSRIVSIYRFVSQFHTLEGLYLIEVHVSNFDSTYFVVMMPRGFDALVC